MGFQVQDMINFFKRKKRINTLSFIRSSESFQFILVRERARAERTGHTFSLVVFSFNQGKGTDAALLRQLGIVLDQRVRIIDELGWYVEGKSIGALLPATTAEGASQFIEIIRQRMGEAESSLRSTVYTYPFPLDNSVGGKEAAVESDSRSKPMFSSVVIENSSPPEVLYARRFPLWKRAFDLFGALLFLVLLSPLFLLTALCIKIVSPGPVIYRQERIGYMRRPFRFLKFRTMHINNDAEGHRQYLSQLIENDAPMTKMDDGNDTRIIPFGKFLRSSSMDELPQLINVLRGDMSLVGPRPCLAYEAEKYLHWHTRHFDTMPGMTGLWQVSGKNRSTFKEMIRFDIRYSQTMSPLLDIKILLLTGPAILRMIFESREQKAKIRQVGEDFTPSRKRESVR